LSKICKFLQSTLICLFRLQRCGSERELHIHILLCSSTPLCIKQFYWLRFEFRKTTLAELILNKPNLIGSSDLNHKTSTNVKRTYRYCYGMNHVFNNNVSCFIHKHSVARLLPTRHVMLCPGSSYSMPYPHLYLLLFSLLINYKQQN
jgi:hypothetical protein